MSKEADDHPITDLPHEAARKETGFWGREGAGCIVLARSTGRLLVGLRSDEVMESGTWGTWGGAIDEGLSPEEGVRRELLQETEISDLEGMVPLHVYVSPKGDFRYHNFIAVIPDEIEPALNWEHDGFVWTTLDAMPDPLHYGLEALLREADVASAIAGILGCRAASILR